MQKNNLHHCFTEADSARRFVEVNVNDRYCLFSTDYCIIQNTIMQFNSRRIKLFQIRKLSYFDTLS